MPPVSRSSTTRPVRVALVTPGYPPRIGGVEVHVAALAAGLAADGYAVTVLSQMVSDDPAPRRETTDDGVEIHRFPDVLRSLRFPVAPGLRAYLRRHADEFDVVHAHSFHAWPALVAATAAQRTFVFTPHYHGVGHTATARLAHLVYDPLASRIFRRADRIICVSGIEAVKLQADYPSTRATTVIIPNGIDLASIDAATPRVSDHPVVLVAGRIEEYKQVDLVVSAMAHLSHDAELVVVGDGPARRSVERVAAGTATRRPVRFLGRIGEDELRSWQRTASLTVCMSKEEAFGMVAAEGVASGSTVLASDIPAHRELAGRVGERITLVRAEIAPQPLAALMDTVLGSERPPPVPTGVPLFLDWTDVVDRTERAYALDPLDPLGT